ncbi:hypothetical protein KIPB_009112 [Kipferlia bialata]|uniref:Uncharacterized protein n=1 Tax=Kipferlia bialata TaxID=797122 RepID=A0A9K3GL94_9EUKA|nr:hypothetical protein KIPB_009112 [Kipferlia bialata]|eukprot:g9112.t1
MGIQIRAERPDAEETEDDECYIILECRYSGYNDYLMALAGIWGYTVYSSRPSFGDTIGAGMAELYAQMAAVKEHMTSKRYAEEKRRVMMTDPGRYCILYTGDNDIHWSPKTCGLIADALETVDAQDLQASVNQDHWPDNAMANMHTEFLEGLKKYCVGKGLHGIGG